MRSIIKKSQKNKKSARVVMLIFFSIFAAVGGGMLYPLGIRPIYKTFDARSWETVPCKIISAKVKTHTGDGTTYSVDIKYEYQFNNKTYKNDRYGLVKFSSSGRKNKQKVVDLYKKSKNPVCFVNPDKPSESILKRGFHLGLLFTLFPLPFAAIGFGGLYWAIFRSGKRKVFPSSKQWLPETDNTASDTQSYENPYQVDSIEDFTYADSGMLEINSTSPLKKLFGAIFIAAFWNGIVSVFVVQLFNDFQWFLALFLTPFILIGLFLIGMVVYSFLALFNPRPRIMLSTVAVKPGDPVKMQWQFSGRTSILRNLTIKLLAKERATYRRGTDTQTDTNTFFNTEIISTDDPNQIPFGDIYFSTPENAMHSFDAPNNKIIWEIKLQAEIKSWPDVDQTYKITVMP